MNGHRMTSLVIASCLLLGACSKPPESPVARTNPHPVDRYEITVELVDPPPDIKSISGTAYFSIPDVICMPTPDRIAGYTPGSRYEKEFDLLPTGHNTYKGHIFLDWPINEDYYGLGVCKWKLNIASVTMTMDGYQQKAVLWGGTDFPSMGRRWWCRRPDSKRMLESCTSPSDPARAELESRDSYAVVLSSARL